MIRKILNKVDCGKELAPDEIKSLLEISDADDLQALYDCAYRVKERHVGKVAYFRGIIECSNICIKDCYYCGIRKSNRNVERFQMDEDEIIREAIWAFENEYGSAVIQSGERKDAAYIDMIERVVRTIKEKTDGKLGITLSLGEQTEETYRRWREAGAHRYLLRIETTNPELYKKLHPADHSLEERKRCLTLLKKTGWQVGTGVMMGLPGQTMQDLTDDILFMKEIDIDMVGMGPYIPHRDTPMGQEIPPYTDAQKQAALTLGLKMIALIRIVLKDINIAAATALQALEHTGREMGLQCGANVIMPNVTETEYRPNYTLYDNKPCTDENSSMCRGCLTARITGIGETIGFNEWGDSRHYFKRTEGSA
ncbi:[FeFe] hydrogenase H-cluster radical SAM maturase HydE [Tichowtungia aerotolerans]|uniref:[FeFe] hydrogenase H-cluster radical SAM maturase HydE n=1 Tax=Tichowtungia aerotolerans TaxID=2697043 RepID=A0A6P1MFN3_9BACT|nr:[FeFe] hydrogenase H-cluster radical SAM maturase HydE [Tichowtungia aerotolerans]QHI69885.1 [FeFe] hydrogenase H-cluster radical SAM maturase HydE [Tichowtungia aerotolerans]